MLVRVPAVCAVVLLLSSTVVSAAQAFKWWQADAVIKELGLSPEQTRRLEDIFQKSLPRLKAQKTTLDEAEAQFDRLLERGDEAAMEQINVVEAARAELNKSRNQMLFAMRKVLTQDQWARFTALHLAAEKSGATDRERNNGK
jgi:Spy/CpxP family protein refolding chaperone